jgi:mono/diheme cytochrome c family protein
VGIIYAISAWMSLFIINGILTFMLTPGDWLVTRSFWDGWLNPTFWPSLALRTISALAIAGIFVAVVANLDKTLNREQRRHVIGEGSLFLVPLALMIPASAWFFAASPSQASGLALGGAVAMTMFLGFGILASTLVGLYAYFGLIKNKRLVNLETALLLTAIALIATGSMEYVREGIRKPWVVYGYMYANGLTRDQLDEFNQTGFFASNPVIARDANIAGLGAVEKGRLIYKVQCQRCHEIDGYNAMRPLVASWSVEMIRANTRVLHRLKPFMPPFGGTDEDLEDLVAYLSTLRSAEWDTLHSEHPSTEGGRR